MAPRGILLCLSPIAVQTKCLLSNLAVIIKSEIIVGMLKLVWKNLKFKFIFSHGSFQRLWPTGVRRIDLPQRDMACGLGISLDSEFILEE